MTVKERKNNERKESILELKKFCIANGLTKCGFMDYVYRLGQIWVDVEIKEVSIDNRLIADERKINCKYKNMHKFFFPTVEEAKEKISEFIEDQKKLGERERK